MSIHKQWPSIKVKQSLKWKLTNFDKNPKSSTLMARFLVDVLFDRKKILNYSLDDLITKEKDRMTFLFSYVQAFYKLTSMSKVRSAISDKIGHFPGRTKPPSSPKTSKSTQNEQSEADSLGELQAIEINIQEMEASERENDSLLSDERPNLDMLKFM